MHSVPVGGVLTGASRMRGVSSGDDLIKVSKVESVDE